MTAAPATGTRPFSLSLASLSGGMAVSVICGSVTGEREGQVCLLRYVRGAAGRSLAEAPEGLDDLSGGLGEQVGMDEPVDVAVQDALGVSDLVPGPMVLDLLVGLEDVAADVRAPEAGVRGHPALAGDLGLALLELELSE